MVQNLVVAQWTEWFGVHYGDEFYIFVDVRYKNTLLRFEYSYVLRGCQKNWKYLTITTSNEEPLYICKTSYIYNLHCVQMPPSHNINI